MAVCHDLPDLWLVHHGLVETLNSGNLSLCDFCRLGLRYSEHWKPQAPHAPPTNLSNSLRYSALEAGKSTSVQVRHDTQAPTAPKRAGPQALLGTYIPAQVVGLWTLTLGQFPAMWVLLKRFSAVRKFKIPGSKDECGLRVQNLVLTPHATFELKFRSAPALISLASRLLLLSASSSLKIRHLGSGGVGTINDSAHRSCIALNTLNVVVYTVVSHSCPRANETSDLHRTFLGHFRNRRAESAHNFNELGFLSLRDGPDYGNGDDGNHDNVDDGEDGDGHDGHEDKEHDDRLTMRTRMMRKRVTRMMPMIRLPMLMAMAESYTQL